MQITYLGHASFLIETNDKKIVIDPYTPDTVGLDWKEQEADIVLITHQHEDHNYLEGVAGDPFVISQPGEYELSGITISGLPAYHDDKQGAERGATTIFLLESEGIYLGHFGDIGHELEEEQQERLGVVDVLMIPVGGVFTIDAQKAANMVAEIEPRIVIPMHYHRDGSKTEEWKLAPVTDFLKEMGSEDVQPQKNFKASNVNNLPEETEVVLLKPQF